jgi:hypothetical protein
VPYDLNQLSFGHGSEKKREFEQKLAKTAKKKIVLPAAQTP